MRERSRLCVWGEKSAEQTTGTKGRQPISYIWMWVLIYLKSVNLNLWRTIFKSFVKNNCTSDWGRTLGGRTKFDMCWHGGEKNLKNSKFVTIWVLFYKHILVQKLLSSSGCFIKSLSGLDCIQTQSSIRKKLCFLFGAKAMNSFGILCINFYPNLKINQKQ